MQFAVRAVRPYCIRAYCVRTACVHACRRVRMQALERKLLADAAQAAKRQTNKMRARLASLCAAETTGAAKLQALQAALRPQAAVLKPKPN
jgi:hypothetical protein